jgi:hypothetical protein
LESKYLEWIERETNQYSDRELAGMCKWFVDAMKGEFPELTVVRGHYHCVYSNKSYCHWWLKTKSEIVVDPTARQFPFSGLVGEYVEFDEDSQEPTGKCLNCGEYVYGGNTFCNSDCSGHWVRSM